MSLLLLFQSNAAAGFEATGVINYESLKGFETTGAVNYESRFQAFIPWKTTRRRGRYRNPQQRPGAPSDG